jgi:hypothetical protein
MNLPVPDLAVALPFYETALGFRLLSRSEAPHKSAVLIRDKVQIGLAENGGDSTQGGCAFHVNGLSSVTGRLVLPTRWLNLFASATRQTPRPAVL